MYTFSKASINNMKGVGAELMLTFMHAIKVSPIDFGVPSTGGYRTAETQGYLFKTTKTKCDGVKNKSRHQSGLALDMYAYINGGVSYEKQHLSMVAGVVLSTYATLQAQGKVSKDYKLVWGGTFDSNSLDGWDMPHFELVKL